jgi:invasion protein IalB
MRKPIWHVMAGILVGAVAVVMVVGTSAAQAQQPPAKKAPAAAAQTPQQPAAAAAGQQSAWVKLCEKVKATTKDKEGKDQTRDMNICLTHHERLDGNSGMVLVSAALRQVEGQDKQHFMVMVPLGMMLQPGMRAAVYPKEMWEKIQKNEKVDDSKVKQLTLAYTLCHPAGCTAEVESTPDLLSELKTGGGLMIFAINVGGAPIAFPIPLNGFDVAFAGPPVDAQKYSDARRALMQQIAARQQAIMDEQKKQQEAAAAKPGAPAQKK